MPYVRVMRTLLGAVVAAGGTYGYLALWAEPPELSEHPFFAGSEVPWVMAHRGGSGLAPENTLAAFEHAEKLGVDVLEMDLRVSGDGELVVMHDADVRRTTDGTGLVSELSLDELKTLDAGYRFEPAPDRFPRRGDGVAIPTFLEVLARFPRTRLNVEMKEFTAPQASRLCRILRDHGSSDRVLVAAFGHGVMEHFRAQCPTVATSATMREGLLFYQLNRMALGSLYRSPAVALQVPERFGERLVVEPGFLRFARSTNVRVQVWTVNQVEDMRRLLGLGVQGILTDYPDRVLDVLAGAPAAASAPN